MRQKQNAVNVCAKAKRKRIAKDLIINLMLFNSSFEKNKNTERKCNRRQVGSWCTQLAMGMCECEWERNITSDGHQLFWHLTRSSPVLLLLLLRVVAVLFSRSARCICNCFWLLLFLLLCAFFDFCVVLIYANCFIYWVKLLLRIVFWH